MTKQIEQEKIIRITYIKNKTEKNIIVSSDITLGMKDVLKISSENTKIIIEDDIELLQFKGVSFQNIAEIECENPETVLILEQCQFRKETTFRKGSIVLESPEFINADEKYVPYNLLCCENDYVEFLLSDYDSYANNIFQVKGVKNIKITGNAYNLIITETNGIGNSKLQNLYIKGVKHYYAGVLDAQNIVIEDSDIESLTNLKYKKLTIRNATISSEYNNDVLNLNQGKVQIENAFLKGKKIILPDGIHEPTSGSLVYFSEQTKENLLRARFNLMTCLKRMKEQKESKPIPLDCKQLKQPNQAIFILGKETQVASNFQSEEDYYKNQFTIPSRRVRIKQC